MCADLWKLLANTKNNKMEQEKMGSYTKQNKIYII